MSTASASTPILPQESAASLTTLQCELRALFASMPTNRALVQVLERLAVRLGASYAVVHARIGTHLLSEEWIHPGGEISGDTREFVNTRLWEAISAEEARCTRVPGGDGRAVLVTAVTYDQDIEPTGGAAIVIHSTSKARVLQAIAQLEGILGFVSLLIDGAEGSGRKVVERRAIEPHAAASHPTRLAYAIIGELEARHGFGVTGIGFVDRGRVKVAAISGVEGIRAANPGVMVMRAAMEECLDRGSPIVFDRADSNHEEDDCRLHAQWSQEVNGAPVASLPLVFLDEVVAVISMIQGTGAKLSREQLDLVAEELTGYAALVPLSRGASRGLLRHALDSLCDGARDLFSGRNRRGIVALALTCLATLWLVFGTLDHTFTVPCKIKAAEQWTVACPRAGVLTETFVLPGDRVRAGQLLAALDPKDDILKHAELTAEIESLEALIDHAISTRDSGERRVHEARKRSVQAQLAIVDENIGRSEIRAPRDGLILEGDLRELLGGRLKMGDRLFELARHDKASVVVEIPERLVLSAHECVTAVFAPSAQPDVLYPLDELRIAPAGSVVDGDNVFLGEGTVPISLSRMPPGMEGTVQIDAGPHGAWWVLTHRITDWLRLNFWL